MLLEKPEHIYKVYIVKKFLYSSTISTGFPPNGGDGGQGLSRLSLFRWKAHGHLLRFIYVKLKAAAAKTFH